MNMQAGKELPQPDESTLSPKGQSRRDFLRRVGAAAVIGGGALFAPELTRVALALGDTPVSASASDRSPNSVGEPTPFESGMFYPIEGDRGFAVGGDILEALQARGDTAVWGAPVSSEFTDEMGRKTQYFEKGGFQVEDRGKDGKAVSFVNIFDELSRLGKDAWLDSTRQVPLPQDWSSDQGKPWEQVVQSHLALTDSHLGLRQAIDSNPDWLDMYGLPVAIRDYGDWVSLRMQRANLQLLKKDLPYGSTGEVLVANGGTVAKEAGDLIPPYALEIRSLAEIQRPFPHEIGTEVDSVRVINNGVRHGLNVTDFTRLNEVAASYAAQHGKKVEVRTYDDYHTIPNFSGTSTLTTPDYYLQNPDGNGVMYIGFTDYGYKQMTEENERLILTIGFDPETIDRVLQGPLFTEPQEDTFADWRKQHISMRISELMAGLIQFGDPITMRWPETRDPNTRQNRIMFNPDTAQLVRPNSAAQIT